MKRRSSREDSTEMISTDTPANVTEGADLPHSETRSMSVPPRTVALVWLSTYLAASGIVLMSRGAPALAVLHAALIAVGVIGIASRGGVWRRLGDLLPLVASPLLYGEIPSLIAALGSSYHDAAVQQIELQL